MATLNHTDGFILHGWMVTELHLGGADLLTFALVHQFSQSEAGVYIGGVPYLCSWTGWSPNTARKHLQTLVALGLITERRGERNGVQFVTYKTSEGVRQFLRGYLKNCGGVPQNLRIENNKENNADKSAIGIRGEVFDFAKEIERLGVPAEVVADWMKVRGAKRADNTRTAFQGIVREIQKSGHTAEECIRFSCEHGWRGFEAAWMEREDRERQARQAPAPKQETHMDYYTRVMRELHPERYGTVDNQ